MSLFILELILINLYRFCFCRFVNLKMFSKINFYWLYFYRLEIDNFILLGYIFVYVTVLEKL